MSEFNNYENNMETTETNPVDMEVHEDVYPQWQPEYIKPEPEVTTVTTDAKNIAGAFAAGAAIGYGVKSLVGRVKAKLAQKETGVKPAKVKKKAHLRSPFYWEVVQEVPVAPQQEQTPPAPSTVPENGAAQQKEA